MHIGTSWLQAPRLFAKVEGIVAAVAFSLKADSTVL